MTEYQLRQMGLVLTAEDDPEKMEVEWQYGGMWIPKLRAALFLVADDVIEVVKDRVPNHTDIETIDWRIQMYTQIRLEDEFRQEWRKP